jgi:hypothetical protein
MDIATGGLGRESNREQMARTYVSFESDLPDDGEWDDGENPVSPPGLAIANLLRGSLKSESIEVGEPENHEGFGWEFDCSVGRSVVWVLIQAANPWLIIVGLVPWVLNPLRGWSGAESLQQVCRTIDKSLKGSSRFREVRWFTREEYESQPRPRGAAAP